MVFMNYLKNITEAQFSSHGKFLKVKYRINYWLSNIIKIDYVCIYI